MLQGILYTIALMNDTLCRKISTKLGKFLQTMSYDTFTKNVINSDKGNPGILQFCIDNF